LVLFVSVQLGWGFYWVLGLRYGTIIISITNCVVELFEYMNNKNDMGSMSVLVKSLPQRANIGVSKGEWRMVMITMNSVVSCKLDTNDTHIQSIHDTPEKREQRTVLSLPYHTI